MNSRRQSKQERRRDEQRRREEERLQTAKKRRLLISSLVALLIVALVVVTIYVVNANQTANAGAAGPVTTTIPACNPTEQLDYHVHMHVSIYVNGKLVPIAQGIGIVLDSSNQVSCYYQTHTHDSTGIIHIEAPKATTFTLGAFLNLWKDQFPSLQYPAELDNTTGWQTYVDGKAYTGDLTGITLTPHKLVTLTYNSPKVKPDTTYAWADL